MCTYIRVCTYIHICTHIYVYIHIYTHVYTYIHTCIHIYTYIYIHIYIYAHIYIYINTYTHMPFHPSPFDLVQRAPALSHPSNWSICTQPRSSISLDTMMWPGSYSDVTELWEHGEQYSNVHQFWGTPCVVLVAAKVAQIILWLGWGCQLPGKVA